MKQIEKATGDECHTVASSVSESIKKDLLIEGLL